jgi:Icc-related predicted phosphoesterase
MKILFLSDTHTQHRQLRNLPDADVFVHSGDMSAMDFRTPNADAEKNAQDFIDWMNALNYRYKIFIAGNHDLYFASKTREEIQQSLPENMYYLCDSGVEIEGVKFWGSPVSPIFHNVWAFTRQRGEKIAQHWSLIPKNTDILLTHCPPFSILDSTANGEHIGCRDLLQTVQAIKPHYHLFGHVHESYGIERQGETTFINGGGLNGNYKIVNQPVVVTISALDSSKQTNSTSQSFE